MSRLSDESGLLQDYVKSRSETAFCTLYLRYVNHVRTVCSREQILPVDLDDITQSVFATLAVKASGIRNQQALRSWLTRVAIRCSRRLIIRNRRRQRNELAKAAGMTTVAATENSVVTSGCSLPEQLNKLLPQHYREVIELKYHQALRTREIAARLQLKPSTVSMRLTRARQWLQKEQGMSPCSF